MLLPRLENDYSVAALASDARVVIDVLMTGGLILSGPGSPGVPPATGRPARDGSSPPRVSFGSMFASQAQRTIATMTGGHARRDDTPFDRAQFMTYSRVTAAANTDTPLADLVVAASAAVGPARPSLTG